MESKIYENYELIKSVLDKNYSIDDYKKILDRLVDEKSKKNLFYRAMYDNTNDAFYSLSMEKEMYSGTGFYSKNDFEMYRFLEFMLKNNNYNKKIFLIGFPFDYSMEDYNRWGIPCALNHKKGWLNVECIFDELYGYTFQMDDKDLYVRNIEDIYKLNISDEMIFIFYNRKYGLVEKYLYTKAPADNIFVYQEQMRFSRNGQYFYEDFVKFDDDEIFFDGGTFCLESSLSFMNVVHGKYRKIYGSEPEEKPYRECLKIIEEQKLENVFVENIGIWSHDTTLKFDACGSGSSSIDENGEYEIKCRSIDNILAGQPVTIIKMDIEGAEYEALIGAKESIAKYTPMLMICVYHKPNDVFKLTNLILSINDNYSLYIRHHSYSRNETVIYCIPKK